MRPDIILSTINAKWIHPSLALRLLKANLRELETRCGIIEFALRQPLAEKVTPILEARPRILGLSVSIWNHDATRVLLEALAKEWEGVARPVVVLGGPEVSHLPPDAAIFRYAHYVIRGEGEHEFRILCEKIISGELPAGGLSPEPMEITAEAVDTDSVKTAYHLYTDDDLSKKLTYVESSRGCPFNCEFCLSAVKREAGVRCFPTEQFFSEMNDLVERGARTFKFLDRTFNLDINRARQIMEFFLEKIESRAAQAGAPLVVHFEMVPSRFPPALRKTLRRFPPGSLRLEIGIQTLNTEVSARISRPSDPEKDLETLRFLRDETNAIIHADLIAGLPGEDFASFGRGFDRLWEVVSRNGAHTEIQLGILKLLPGAPIARHTETFGMRYNTSPPYEVLETAALPAVELNRIKNFARFWELIVNRRLADFAPPVFAGHEISVFNSFMSLSDSLLTQFGRNWGIDRADLRQAVGETAIFD